MKQTMRHTGIFGLVLACALGLAFVLASAWPAVAGPVGVTPLPPVRETDERAGACYSFYYDPAPSRPFIPMALDVGSRWDRFDFRWANIEKKDGVWDAGVRDGYDALVNDLDAAGMNLVGILLWTPGWAATGRVSGFWLPRFDVRPPGWYAPVARAALAPGAISAASSPPRGLYLPWNDPHNYWGCFVYAIVSRYGERVKYWEMWNEAEWDYFWTGSDADYAQLLKVGYQATKAACPDCTVLFAGLHYWDDPAFFERVLDILNDDPAAPGNNYFFDVMSVHLYSRSSNAYDVMSHIRSRMRAYVPDHPLWLTETGVPVWDDSRVDPNPTEYDYAATQEEAAAYVVQSYANAWASGVERYFFFRTNDADVEILREYFGLLRNDHTLRPAYVAYQVATTYLISPTFTTRVLTGSHVRVTLWGTPRGKVSVLWNGSPVTGVYTLPATLPTATLVDRWGVTRTVTATGVLTGEAASYVYTVTLPAATANLVSNPSDYFIGGDPLLVIESETPDEPPTSIVHALPEITYTPTFTVTWEGQDSGAGVWLYDVQVRDGEGEWDYLQHSTAVASSQFTGQHGHTYYFRARATDRVGNWSAWPEAPQAYTTLSLSSTLHLSIGAFFADENRNGAWDEPIAETNEITLTAVALRFVDGTGLDVVSPTVGSALEFTTTVYAGQSYRLQATTADHARMLSLTWPRAGEVYTETYPVLGLWPVTRTYLPLVLRQAPGGV